MRENAALVEALVSNPPELHVWGGQPRIGGMGHEIGRRLARNVRAARPDGDRFEVLETGAGLSTLLLLALGASHVTSVDPTAGLRDRIAAEAERRGLDFSRVDYIEERSEIRLPTLAASDRSFDLCLIDGSHAWPTVFVDFCYANACLRQGGVLLLDDVQLHAVRELYLFLSAQPQYRLISEQWDWKLAAFVKETRERFVPNDQPYLRTASGGFQ